MTAADWWRKMWFQVESAFVCFGLMWCPYFLHSYGGSFGLFCLFLIPYFEEKLFSFVWITLDFFCSFLSDIDSLLWTKHSSILSQEASSVEENEPVEGMQNNLTTNWAAFIILFISLSTEANDCYSDREAAQEEVDHGAKGMYVPECTPDNKYQRVQCHKSAGRNAVVFFGLISSSCHIPDRVWSCLRSSRPLFLSLFVFVLGWVLFP